MTTHNRHAASEQKRIRKHPAVEVSTNGVPSILSYSKVYSVWSESAVRIRKYPWRDRGNDHGHWKRLRFLTYKFGKYYHSVPLWYRRYVCSLTSSGWKMFVRDLNKDLSDAISGTTSVSGQFAPTESAAKSGEPDDSVITDDSIPWIDKGKWPSQLDNYQEPEVAFLSQPAVDLPPAVPDLPDPSLLRQKIEYQTEVLKTAALLGHDVVKGNVQPKRKGKHVSKSLLAGLNPVENLISSRISQEKIGYPLMPMPDVASTRTVVEVPTKEPNLYIEAVPASMPTKTLEMLEFEEMMAAIAIIEAAKAASRKRSVMQIVRSDEAALLSGKLERIQFEDWDEAYKPLAESADGPKNVQSSLGVSETSEKDLKSRRNAGSSKSPI